jgi:hypothetical protein
VNILTNVKVGQYEMATPGLIACDHCGIIALDTPTFGWQRYYNDDGDLAHHCPAAVQYNQWVSQGLVHMKAPDEAVIYGYWPLPNVFYLVNTQTDFETGPFIGYHDAQSALDMLDGEMHLKTAIFSDGEYHNWRQQLNGH